MADWKTATLRDWFAQSPATNASGFLPLALAGAGDLDRRKAPVGQMQVVLRTAEHPCPSWATGSSARCC